MKPEEYLQYVYRHYTQRNVYLLDGQAKPLVKTSKPSVKE
ncbi:hypothetical protein GV51_1222 [Gardnerella vaginalis 5-1]|nr:hypothetical protein GV51_1222 [Gardnerella vaginalis 5-1]